MCECGGCLYIQYTTYISGGHSFWIAVVREFPHLLQRELSDSQHTKYTSLIKQFNKFSPTF